MKRLMRGLAVAFFAAAILTGTALAQEPKDGTITPEERAKAVDSVCAKLNDLYVFPETAKKAEEALRKHVKDKDYDAITSGQEFAKKLTSDLAAVCHDKHLRVVYRPEGIPKDGFDALTRAQGDDVKRVSEFMNFGFERVERLPGNIGYLDLRNFHPVEIGAETASAAMNLLANTDFLIVDLRKNGGGEPDMIAYISSYLFDEKTHLNDIYDRPSGQTTEHWTKTDVPGKHFGGKKPVYVLTSAFTFSGAEEFTYNLKNLKRATIIGETTGGGANPGGIQPLSEHFAAFIPVGRAINPITKTNWEGTGVEPDIKVPADQALKVAQIDALTKQIAKQTDEGLVDRLKKSLEDIKRELEELKRKPSGPGNPTSR
jgi:retinol-binding protein 3